MPAAKQDSRFDIFISYRRGAADELALLLQTKLQQRGLSAFVDRDLMRGRFDNTLLCRIAESPSFLIILTPNALDRCSDEEDWVRKEIVQAISDKRNIIPLQIGSFQFTPEIVRRLDPAVRELSRYQVVEYSRTYFESTIERIVKIVEEDKIERKIAQEAEERRLAAERAEAEKNERGRAEAERRTRQSIQSEARRLAEQERLAREKVERDRLIVKPTKEQERKKTTVGPRKTQAVNARSAAYQPITRLQKWLWTAAFVALLAALVAGSLWRLWPHGSESGKVVAAFDASNGRGYEWVDSVVFSLDGKLLAAATMSGIRIFFTDSDKPPRLLEERSLVGSISFSPDSKLIASGNQENTVHIWDINSRTVLRTLAGHGGWVLATAFSPDGRLLASGSGDRTIRLWSTTDWHLVRSLLGHTDMVGSATFSPDGRLLASAGQDQTIVLWEVATGRKLRVLQVDTSPGYAIAFSPDGRSLASGSRGDSVQLWNVDTGSNESTFSGHSHFIYALTFSPNGKFLASGSADKTIRLWDLEASKIVRLLNGHTATVSSLAFSPNGSQLASGGYDRTVRLWDVP